MREMDNALNRIIKDKKALYDILKSEHITAGKKSWKSPADDSIASVNLTCTIAGNEITSTSQLFSLIQENSDKFLESLTRLYSRFGLELSQIVIPSTVPKCPDLNEIKSLLTDDLLDISVFSYSGFNFSSEFAFVYKGKTEKSSALDNIFVIIRRALRIADPMIMDVMAVQFSEMIVRKAAWETGLFMAVTLESLNKEFPHLSPKYEQDKDSYATIPSCQIFLGRNATGELSFTVRCHGEVAVPKDASSALKVVYYREFLLNKAALDEFMQASFAVNNPTMKNVPLPPPKPSSKNDSIRITLVIKNESVLSRIEELRSVKMIEDAVASEIDRAELDSSAGSAEQKEPSFVGPSSTSELYGWGFDCCRSLGIGEKPVAARQAKIAEGVAGQQGGAAGDVSDEFVYNPRPIPVGFPILMQRIRQIACSSMHTLILTQYGLVYACGENSEGALGLGVNDFDSRAVFTLIDWPVQEENEVPPKIRKIAAGSSSIGSHSMAVDEQGQLYGWGVAYATGLGTVKPVTVPTVVPIDAKDVVADEEGEEEAQDADALPPHRKVLDVACGGGFTVCITESGQVLSWGTWAHGRLGLGAIPLVEEKRSLRRKNAKKVARYQLRPEVVGGVEGAVQVGCGDAHVLCLLKDGSVLAWGQNSCGQVGTGPSYAGFLDDAFSPLLVPVFGATGVDSVGRHRQFYFRKGSTAYHSTTAARSGVFAKKVACGALHSLVIDRDGCCWSWGAHGSPCLGHNDAPLMGEWSKKVNTIFSIQTIESTLMVPMELLDWCQTWAMPRKILSLDGVRVEHIAAGDLHTVLLTADRRVFICGNGPAVPSFLSASSVMEDDMLRINSDDEDDEDEGTNASPRKKRTWEEQAQKRIERQQRIGVVVSCPRCPSSSWLHEICTRQISYVASSACRMFVVLGEETITKSLTSAMLHRLIHGSAGADHDTSDKHQTQLDDMSLTSGSLSGNSDSNRYNSVFETRGKADCMVIASGKVFLAHKALLAQRSGELRDMIAMETPTDHAYGAPVQILLPELQRDSARALLHYLYCDTLPQWLFVNSTVRSTGNSITSVFRSLIHSAQLLRLPRLQLMCERYLKLMMSPLAWAEELESGRAFVDLPPCTLARDLGALVGDREFADVRFIAEGRAILAHRFVLECRCEYFRAMFRSRMSEHAGIADPQVDVVVPDTFVGFLRMLIFIYTDTLPDGSDTALIEDLLAADRYGITEMRLLSENMLVPSKTNWMKLLRTADAIHSKYLKLQVTAFLRDNFAFLPTTVAEGNALMEEEGAMGNSQLHEMRKEFPGLVEDIFESRKILFPLPPNQLLIAHVTEQNKQLAESSKRMPTFPIWGITIALVCLYFYQRMSSVIVLGPFIPLFNVLFCVAVLLYAFKSM